VGTCKRGEQYLKEGSYIHSQLRLHEQEGGHPPESQVLQRPRQSSGDTASVWLGCAYRGCACQTLQGASEPHELPQVAAFQPGERGVRNENQQDMTVGRENRSYSQGMEALKYLSGSMSPSGEGEGGGSGRCIDQQNSSGILSPGLSMLDGI